ncbi:MAG TPA: hypothetical protein DCZ13_12240 [Porticoccaceae bacterium]|nr:hypothetical protein [Porticoccaceae bacterium]
MKTATLILGIVGALLAGGLGMKWLNDFGQLTELQRAMGGQELQSMGTAALLMIGSLIAGIVGGILSFKRKFLAGGVLMLAAGILPLLLASQAIVFLLPLIAGGILSLYAHFTAAKTITQT